MYGVFSSLSGAVKIKLLTIDNYVFQLHYQWTCLILILFSIMSSLKQFFGDPITCFTAMNEVPDNVLNNYCWMQSTFTLPEATSKKVGTEVIYPGVDKSTPDQEKTYHSYYQWVVFFLFFQAILFYIPRFLWKSMEGGTVQKILNSLDQPIFEKDSDRGAKLDLLSQYLNDTLGCHDCYAYCFYFCEVLNFVNVVGQIYFTNLFLGGEFTTYGTEVIQFAQTDQRNRTDPMIEVFPRVTKCAFYKTGPSGSVQTHDALCVLPNNIVNEKAFIFFWFWYIILSVISGLVLVYRIILLVSRSFRSHVTLNYHRCAKVENVIYITRHIKVGDWFLLHLLGKNINRVHFGELMEHLAKKIKKKVEIGLVKTH